MATTTREAAQTIRKGDGVLIISGPWKGAYATVLNPAYGCQGRNLTARIYGRFGMITILYRDEVVVTTLANASY